MFQPKGQNSQVLVKVTSEDRKRTELWRDPCHRAPKVHGRCIYLLKLSGKRTEMGMTYAESLRLVIIFTIQVEGVFFSYPEPLSESKSVDLALFVVII
ncbi:hypothetical protein J2T13_004097 [Paenibacillus sp. DS2015]